MKKAFGPSAIRIAPLLSASGDIIRDPNKQIERCAEHYQTLFSKINTVRAKAVEATTHLPTMEELDAPPAIAELSKAIDSLASGKVPGSYGIPPEIIKISKDSSLLNHLQILLLKCWEERSVPTGFPFSALWERPLQE